MQAQDSYTPVRARSFVMCIVQWCNTDTFTSHSDKFSVGICQTRDTHSHTRTHTQNQNCKTKSQLIQKNISDETVRSNYALILAHVVAVCTSLWNIKRINLRQTKKKSRASSKKNTHNKSQIEHISLWTPRSLFCCVRVRKFFRTKHELEHTSKSPCD